MSGLTLSPRPQQSRLVALPVARGDRCALVGLYNGSTWQTLWDNVLDPLGRVNWEPLGNGAAMAYDYEEPDTLVGAVGIALEPISGGWSSVAWYSYAYDGDRRVNSQYTGVVGTGTAYLAHPAAAGTTTYSTPNTLNQIPGISGGAAFSYNANGNLTSDGTCSYTYDQEGDGHIVSAGIGGSTVGTYGYDPLGRRFSKTTSAGTTYYLHDIQGNEIAEYTGSSATGSWTLSRKLMYDPRQVAPVAMLSGGAFTYNHYDQQGSVMAISNQSGNPVTQYAYLAYGDSAPPNIAACLGAGGGSSTCGSPSGTGFGYAGYRYDPETGLYHTGARYYDPRLGRFLQPDPIGQAGGLHLYAYVQNDPLNGTDPLGLWTLQVGVSFYGGAWWLGGQVNVGIVADSHGNAGFYGTAGGGPTAGVGLKLVGIGGAYSNAPTINDLNGPGAGVSAVAGTGLGGSIDWSQGHTNSGTSYQSWGGSVGVVGGAAVSAGPSGTYVICQVGPDCGNSSQPAPSNGAVPALPGPASSNTPTSSVIPASLTSTPQGSSSIGGTTGSQTPSLK